MGLEREEMLDVVARFNGLEHPMELVGTYHDITFYNDSISTIPAACIAAVEALKNVNFTVEKGEYVAIMGESGSGKTTLLNILAALVKPTVGTVVLDGMNLEKIKESAMAQFRRDNLGYVFQDFNLLDTFTLEDNIYLPLVLAGKKHKEMKERLDYLAPALGIKELLKKYPYEVSADRSREQLLPELLSRILR